jgi:outer membrane protein TolC
MDIAFGNNPETRRMWHLSRVAAAQGKRAQSAFFPMVNLTAGTARVRTENPPYSAVYSTVSSYPAAELNYVLFTFGSNVANARAAQQNLLAANFQYNRTLQTVLYQVQRSYFELSAAMATTAASEANLKDATEALKMTEVRLMTGLGDRQTFLQAKANALQAQYALDAALALVEGKRAVLARVIGVRVSENFCIVPGKLPERLTLLDGEVQQMMSRALQGRPDLLALHAQLQAAEQGVKAAKADLCPKVVLSMSGALNNYAHSGSAETFKAFLGLSWDILDGGNRYYQIAEQKEKKQSMVAALQAAEVEVLGDIWTAYYGYRSAFQRVQAAREMLGAATEAFQAMDTSYRNGLCSFTDFLHAQGVLATARANLVAAESDFSITLAGLAYVTGSMDPFSKF